VSDTPWGALFDLDGVLIDSGPFHFAAWQWLALQYGREFGRELFDRTFGMPNAAILPQLFADEVLSQERIAELGERKEERYRALVADQLDWMPGARDLIDALRNDPSCRIGLFTSTPLSNLDFIDARIGLRSRLHAVVHGAEVERGKPAPDGWLLLARRLDLDPGRCVVIEDAPAGIAAGRAAGMAVAAVATTHRPAALAGADRVFERVADLRAADLRTMADRRKPPDGLQSKAVSQGPREDQSKEAAPDGGGAAELLKKLVYLGAGTFFMTQDAAARAVKELRLPREAVGTILQSVERNRDELIAAVKGSLRDFLREVDIVKLARHTIRGMNVQVKADFKITFDDDKKG
jgi:HAD superfamily hydrolase (TIGR01509 family)